MMDELYPIIRRVRRPLIVNDAPPVAASLSDEAQPVAPMPFVEGAATDGDPMVSDAKAARKRSAR